MSTSAPLIRLEGVGKAYPLLHTGGRKLAHFWSLLRAEVADLLSVLPAPEAPKQ